MKSLKLAAVMVAVLTLSACANGGRQGMMMSGGHGKETCAMMQDNKTNPDGKKCKMMQEGKPCPMMQEKSTAKTEEAPAKASETNHTKHH